LCFNRSDASDAVPYPQLGNTHYRDTSYPTLTVDNDPTIESRLDLVIRGARSSIQCIQQDRCVAPLLTQAPRHSKREAGASSID